MCVLCSHSKRQKEFSTAANRILRIQASIFSRWLCLMSFILLISLFASPLGAFDGFTPLELPEFTMLGVGVGGYPDYMGSDDYVFGAAPFFRYQFDNERFLTLIANELRVNLLGDAHWRLGPSATYRFGRKDVKDDVVNRVHQVDNSLALGGFAGYQWYEKSDPLKMIGVSLDFQTDVTNSSSGWTSAASLYGSFPISKPLVLLAGTGTTYASSSYMNENFGVTPYDTQVSGLKSYFADSGFRDARGWVGTMFNLSREWHLMTSVMYSGLLDHAGNSPIVADRGSSNQWVYGLGALYSW